LAAALLILVPVSSSVRASSVQVIERDTVIPTYLAGEPERSPMFYFGRQSQGAEGRIYPYPLYDTLTGRKVDKSYKLVTIENEYMRIGILPEIGGRVFEAVDKTNGYNFFYRQHVIKPALIGLIGAWISGGVEWNIPHHHRASTFLPVQYRIVANPDGSKTVWVGELEVRHRMRWAVGYTLRPGKSYLEASIRIVNRTPVSNTMLCFANAAVHATRDYQVIFPPSTQYVTHHHKRQFTTWPIATTSYGGYDFRPATDVSWFKNHIAANSMFAWNYSDDFFAGYDHGKQAGTMSVADHHVVPGKKLWTWGNGPRGRMWDKILTDEDGPYIELMVGAYSDNQPDYSWLQPYEVKSFSMFWYPFRGIGGVKKANLDAAVNLEAGDTQHVKLGFCTTGSHPHATARLVGGSQKFVDESVAIDPGHPFLKELALPASADAEHLRASLTVDGKELVEYVPAKPVPTPIPRPEPSPPTPSEIKTVEELYLTGLKIEQFHDPNLEPDPYWTEALKRDPGDTRTNTSVGIKRLKEARYAEAEAHLRKAIERLTASYTSPKDGEPFYYLGLALRGQGRAAEATDALFKATWSLAWRAAAYQQLAELATLRGDFQAALDLVDRSLEVNSLDSRALNHKAAVLRHLGQSPAALRTLDRCTTASDPLDVRATAERWLTTRSDEDARAMTAAMLAHPATAIETAAEYQSAGLWQDGLDVLAQLIADAGDASRVSPLTYYQLAFFAEKLGMKDPARLARAAGRYGSPDYVFPFQPETIDVLRSAMQADSKDPRAPYYLGNLLFDWQPDEATSLWEKSAALDPLLAMVHRNLAIAKSHRPQANDLEAAIAELEKAVALPDPLPLHFLELDELYAAAGKPPEERLTMLERHHETVARRAETLSREIGQLVLNGRYDDAIRFMTGRRFEVWEGGTLSVAEDWANAHIQRGHQHRTAGRFQQAAADYEAAGHVPDNLSSDEGADSPHKAEIAYFQGLTAEARGDKDPARRFWQVAANGGPAQPRRGRRANRSAQGPQRFYQALSMRKLDQNAECETILRELANSASAADPDPASQIDGSAPAAVRQAQRERLADRHYLAALGYLGLGQEDKGREQLRLCLKVKPDHLGARTALSGRLAGS
jgi:tetratricopeptide (TPR) repeat protein